MEADAFAHQQKLAYHTKAKQILEEWVRYEANQREAEQRRIADEVMAKVRAAISEPKFVLIFSSFFVLFAAVERVESAYHHFETCNSKRLICRNA